jgi:nardilysin
MKSVSIEAFFHGNVGSADAKIAQESILDVLNSSGGGGLAKKNYPKEPVIQIPSTAVVQLVTCPAKNPSEHNTAVEIYIQLGKDNLHDRVMTDFLAHIMYEPLYDQLRTKDQFGYSVSCDSRWTSGIMGLYFSVVSSTKSAVSISKSKCIFSPERSACANTTFIMNRRKSRLGLTPS